MARRSARARRAWRSCGHPHDGGHAQEHWRHGLGASGHWLRRVALHRLSPVRGTSATLGCKRDRRRAGFGPKSCSPRCEVRVPMQRPCEPSRQCFIGLNAKRVQLGTVWVATATHAATDCARRAVRQQYGNSTATKPAQKAKKSAGANLLTLAFFGSPTWARTRDLRINSPALYRLSYRGTSLALYDENSARKELVRHFQFGSELP